jgi:hypothetical protein
VFGRQQTQGLLPPGTAYDLFRGTAASQRDEVEAYPSSLAAKVTFGAKTHPEVAIFSPDGTMLVSGSSDGFIEVRGRLGAGCSVTICILTALCPDAFELQVSYCCSFCAVDVPAAMPNMPLCTYVTTLPSACCCCCCHCC